MKHIPILVPILCVCLVSVVWSQQPVATGRNWAEFHKHNMARPNPYEHGLNVNNVGSLQPPWSPRSAAEFRRPQ